MDSGKVATYTQHLSLLLSASIFHLLSQTAAEIVKQWGARIDMVSILMLRLEYGPGDQTLSHKSMEVVLCPKTSWLLGAVDYPRGRLSLVLCKCFWSHWPQEARKEQLSL